MSNNSLNGEMTFCNSQDTMMRMFIVVIVFLVTAFDGFCQSNIVFKRAEHYKKRQFNVAIFPENYKRSIPTPRFTPTRNDIDKAEVALRSNLASLNENLKNQLSGPVIHERLNKYKRQYFGYIDKNGNRILLINCFWSKLDDKGKDWLRRRVGVNDGGSYFWNVKFNIDKNELFDLNVNGFG